MAYSKSTIILCNLTEVSPLESHGCFSALMSSKNQCRGEAKKLLQRRVKDAVSASAVMFSGYSEHDAQEFLNHCLVQLKEDGEKLVMAGEELQAGSPGISLSMYSCPVSTNMDFQLQYKMTCTGNPGNMHSCQLSEPLKENRPEKTGELCSSYRLISLVSHLGRQVSTGHYISDVYDFLTDKWLTYNDEKVSETDESAVQAERKCTGYIFFYMHNVHKMIYFGNGSTMVVTMNSNPAGLTFTEGDIAVSNKRSAITCSGNSCLWPKSVDGFVYVPYIISPEYNNRDRITIEIGMQDISTGTCIKFVPRTHQADYLDIQPRFG
ncbi:Ubiquitin carboxyl-terminal hydrolase 37 [Acipenser ruthenus]|uniref:ubiquitinyl hydrolase 1 n=1 Tax=Acipenser ruthenus TaxID=7906 RepID=A0A444UA86_ACIRT|nr:Ubiquitin carboxyl-terminal hydrolase 37 [Acipenser ruthenus]